MKCVLIRYALGLSTAVAANLAMACDTFVNNSDPFDINSYSSCATTSQDLSGVWMLVANYEMETSFWGVTLSESRLQRSILQLKDNNNGSVTVSDCNGEDIAREVNFAVQNDNLLITGDDIADYSLYLDTSSSMSGEVKSSSTGWFVPRITSISLDAVKIRDLSGNVTSLGKISSEYGRSGNKKQMVGWPVVCFDNKVITRGYSNSSSYETNQVVNTVDIYAVKSITDGLAGTNAAILSIETPMTNAGELEAELMYRGTDIVGVGDDIDVEYDANSIGGLSGKVNIQDEDRSQVSAVVDFEVAL